MKRFIIIISLIFTTSNVIAIEQIAPYSFDAKTMQFNYRQGYSGLSRAEKSEYKYAEKMMLKAKESSKPDKKIKYYEKILDKIPNYIPAVYELMFLYSGEFKADEVKKQAEKLREIDTNNIIPPDIITDIIARSSFQLKQYEQAAFEFEQIKDPNIQLKNYLILSETFLRLGNYKKSIQYGTKITPSSHDYYRATEILYTASNNSGDINSASKYAQTLINLRPNVAKNYLRAAASCINDNDCKLNYLYKAKKIFLKSPEPELYKTDKLIAEIEQRKIDNSYKQITDFLVKPEWQKLYIENSPNINFYIENWSKPQDNFFKTANECISKYKGNNLVKCFEALNNSEEKRIGEVKEYLKELKELQKRQEQELLLQKLLILQQQMNYNRYYYYPYRYIYQPYYYW